MLQLLLMLLLLLSLFLLMLLLPMLSMLLLLRLLLLLLRLLLLLLLLRLLWPPLLLLLLLLLHSSLSHLRLARVNVSLHDGTKAQCGADFGWVVTELVLVCQLGDSDGVPRRALPLRRPQVGHPPHFLASLE